jgi:hypothetical protein
MAASTATFLLAYPEFTNAGTSVLTAALAQAETLTSDSFGAQRDVAVYLTMADALARAPMGRDAKLEPAGSTAGTTYQHTLDRLKVANAVTASRLGSR